MEGGREWGMEGGKGGRGGGGGRVSRAAYAPFRSKSTGSLPSPPGAPAPPHTVESLCEIVEVWGVDEHACRTRYLLSTICATATVCTICTICTHSCRASYVVTFQGTYRHMHVKRADMHLTCTPRCARSDACAKHVPIRDAAVQCEPQGLVPPSPCPARYSVSACLTSAGVSTPG